MTIDYFSAAFYPWYGVAAIWVLGMLRSKRTVTLQSRKDRIVQMAFTILGVYLVFSYPPSMPWLATPYLQHSDQVSAIGLAITYLGLALAVWARLQLGGNWSSDVVVKQDHTLISNGPYAMVRHPIYTGFLFGLLGMALITKEIHSLLGLALAFVGFWLKSRNEEVFMRQTFREYPEYEHRVKALIPFIF